MADIELVIRISEEDYETLMNINDSRLPSIIAREHLYNALANGTPLTDCTDAISREAVIEVISNKKAKHIDDRVNNPINYGTLADLEQDIRTLPSVNPTSKPFINKPCCISEKVCHEDKAETLNKIREEIEEVPTVKPCPPYINEFAEEEHYNSKSAGMIKDDILKIIDKYIVKE